MSLCSLRIDFQREAGRWGREQTTTIRLLWSWMCLRVILTRLGGRADINVSKDILVLPPCI